MIISHKHKFIFIKTQKTAGTSIEIALSEICGPEDIITPISDVDESKRFEISNRTAQNYVIPYKDYTKRDVVKFLFKGKRLKYFNHMNALTIRKYIGEDIWNSYYKFTFERNPYDKVVSLYYYSGNSENTTLNDFIKKKKFVKLRGYDQYSINGIPVVDDIFKFEELESSLKLLSEKLNLAKTIKVPNYKAKGGFRSKGKDDLECLTNENREIIRQYFAREMRLMNYIE